MLSKQKKCQSELAKFPQTVDGGCAWIKNNTGKDEEAPDLRLICSSIHV